MLLWESKSHQKKNSNVFPKQIWQPAPISVNAPCPPSCYWRRLLWCVVYCAQTLHPLPFLKKFALNNHFSSAFQRFSTMAARQHGSMLYYLPTTIYKITTFPLPHPASSYCPISPFSFIAEHLRRVASNDILLFLISFPLLRRLTMKLPLPPEKLLLSESLLTSIFPRLVCDWLTNVLKLNSQHSWLCPSSWNTFLLTSTIPNPAEPRQRWGRCIQGAGRKPVWLECTAWCHVRSVRWGEGLGIFWDLKQVINMLLTDVFTCHSGCLWKAGRVGMRAGPWAMLSRLLIHSQ